MPIKITTHDPPSCGDTLDVDPPADGYVLRDAIEARNRITCVWSDGSEEVRRLDELLEAESPDDVLEGRVEKGGEQ